MALRGATSPVEAREGEFSAPWSRAEVASCFYCGVPADSIDHVVPQSLLRDLADDPQARALLIARGRILEVDCCRQCNGLLSSDYDQTLTDRKARLQRQLRRRYARLLDMPDWTDSELGRMGRYLQNYILTHSAMRDWIRERLTYNGPATRYGVRLRSAQPAAPPPLRVSLSRSRNVSLEQGLDLLLRKAAEVAAREVA